MSFRFFQFILMIALSVALDSHAARSPSPAREIPNKLQALEVYENPKISTNLSLRFAELGRLSGLSSVYEPRSVGYPVPFHLAATNESLSKALLVRIDLKVSQEWTEKLYRVSKAYLVPMQLGSQQATVFFIGFQEPEVQKILKSYRQQYASFSNVIFRRAQASEVAPANKAKGSIKAMTESTDRFIHAFNDSSLKCLSGAGESLDESFLEPFVMAGKGMQTLANPKRSLIENFLAMAKATVRDWEILKSFLLNFDQHVNDEVQNFASLPPAEKSRVYCNFFVGSIGGSGWGSKIAGPLKLAGKDLPNTAAAIDHVSAKTESKVSVENKDSKNSQIGSKALTDRGPPLAPAEAIAKLEERLGRKVAYDPEHNLKGDTDIFLYDQKTKQNLGYIAVHFHKEKKILDVDYIGTEAPYREKGVGDALLGAALKEFPNTEFIKTGSLILTNHDAYSDAIAKGMSKVEALKQTPSYKIRAKFGFTEIIEGSINSDLGFIVRRPKPK